MNEMTIACPAQEIPSYPIIWSDSFAGIADAVRGAGLRPSRICIVSDDNVASLYLDALEKAMRSLDTRLVHDTFPGGEAWKHLGTIEQIYRFLAQHGLDRGDLIVALGGGVVGDMAGFAAATYLRGISFIQVPTTLLAMVDSSIGGKTGVDLTGLKNMVGAFFQPRLVYMNLQTLQTLQADQFACGMAEVIKTALIRDAAFFDWLSEHRDAILAKDAEALLHMIRRCCEIKADVVREDPTERGVRAILNFGHTIGHAVEKCSDFTMLHGQSVAVGMAAALAICSSRGLLSRADVTRARDLIASLDLPLHVTGFDPDILVETTRSDKKMRAGQIRFILLERIGSALICDDLSDEELRKAAVSICAGSDAVD